MTFAMKNYEVTTTDFPQAHVYQAWNASRARARAWQAYCSYRFIPFREFLTISSIRRAPDPEGFGRRIMVGGKPAYWVGFNGQYVRFVRPGDDLILLSHPNDVTETAA